jgi:hypothetical protein
MEYRIVGRGCEGGDTAQEGRVNVLVMSSTDAGTMLGMYLQRGSRTKPSV